MPIRVSLPKEVVDKVRYAGNKAADQQHGQILNETSNKSNIKKELKILETINIELEHSVAKLLVENEKLHKENKHLKQTYKDPYDSIKKTRVQARDLNDSLIAQVNSTPHYLPKVREYVLAKPHHVIAPGSSRNTQEESYGSNDMALNHYLNEARKKTQERNSNSKPSVMHTTRLQNTTNGSKQEFAYVNSHAKVQSLKTQNSIKPAEKISNVNKPERWISKGYRISPNKSSARHEKTNTPRSCLRYLKNQKFKEFKSDEQEHWRLQTTLQAPLLKEKNSVIQIENNAKNRYEFVRNPDPISNDETPNFSYLPPQSQTSSLNQFHCFHCKDPLEEGERCQRCNCKRCGYGLREGSCWIFPSRDENSSIDAPNSFNDLTNQAANIDQSPPQEMSIQDMEDLKQHYLDEMQSISNQIQIKDYHNEKIDIRFRKECEITIDELKGKFNGMSIKINKKKELRQLEQATNISTHTPEPLSDSECDLPSCNDFSPINVFEEKSMTFSNPLFDSNDDFTSSDDESLSVEDILEDNVKIDSNPLFEFDDELDEPDLLVTLLYDFNEDECFDPGGDVDEIELLLHRDPSTPKISVASILEGFTNEPSLEENDDLFNLESKENEWKKILYDAPIDLMTEDKVFDPGIHENFFLQHM
ncbi:hypothetical protein Tco_1440036 [Tanacetum coccineum]